MSAVTKADPATPAGSARPLSHRRPLGDRGFAVLALAAGLLVLVILVLIAISTAQQSTSWFSTAGWSGIFSTVWNQATNQFGAMAYLYGTVITSVIAIIIAVPVSVGDRAAADRGRAAPLVAADRVRDRPARRGAVGGLGPVGHHRARPLARSTIYASIASGVNGIPVLGNAVRRADRSGASFFTAGIILAIMITPIITSLSREVIATVPDDRQGGRVRARRHPLGDDPRRRLAAQPGRRGRRGPGRPGPGDGRDDRGGAA